MTRARWLMGTACEITAHGPRAGEAVEAAFAGIARLEETLSTFRPDSEVSRLAASAPASVPVSAELWEVLSLSARLVRSTGGAFDPTYASPAAVRGFGRVRLDPARRAAALPAGGALDFGAIGKGYALDRAAAALRERGVRSALLNFGGQVLAVGAPPGASSWEVALRDPGCPPDAVCPPAARLRLRDASIATSDLAERGAHIVDPRRGAAAAGRSSVSVVLPSAAEADAWSTALFVSGTSAAAPASGCVLRLTPSDRFPITSAPSPALAGEGAEGGEGKGVALERSGNCDAI